MSGNSRRLFLVSCVSQKQRKPMAARDLYSSVWFRMARTYVEASSSQWLILSAKHGLVEPWQKIAPYEATLSSMSAAKRKDWADKVADELRQHCPKGREVIIIAGRSYRENLVPILMQWGCKLYIPLEEKGIGQQLAWFKKRLSTAPNSRPII